MKNKPMTLKEIFLQEEPHAKKQILNKIIDDLIIAEETTSGDEYETCVENAIYLAKIYKEKK